MIRIDKLELPWDAHDVRNYLQRETELFGLFYDLYRIAECRAFYTKFLNGLVKEIRDMTGAADYVPTKANTLAPILMYADERAFNQYALNRAGRFTFDQKARDAILADPYTNEYMKKVTLLHDRASFARSLLSSLKTLEDLPRLRGLSFENHPMVLAKPTWHVLNTGRLSASDPGIQNFSKVISDLITAPKGYQLVFSDSGQIEPRITYSYYIKDNLIKDLITQYNDAYFGILHYITMSPQEEEQARSSGVVFKKEIDAEMKAKRQALKKLTLSATYGSKMAGQDPVLSTLYTNKIVNHPLRLKMQNDIREAVYRGQDSFTTAFGTVIIPDETEKYKKGTAAWPEHVIRCGINNPIQGTAADLMLHSVYNVKNIIYKNPDLHIGYYKHDEGCFYLPEDRTDLIPELQGSLSYQVMDWIPIESDLVIGRKEPCNILDESLYPTAPCDIPCMR